ncbi:MAG TPA: hypothetical protein VN372_12865 [Methanospirillum sp.]|nr:hypothetical protein [Methanospirillum sp.]
MHKILPFLFLVLLLALPAVAEEGGANMTGDYRVRDLGMFTFSTAVALPDPVNGTANEISTGGPADNVTGASGGMSAKKLFQLKKAATEEYKEIANMTGDTEFLTPASAAKSASIVCKFCVPQKIVEP